MFTSRNVFIVVVVYIIISIFQSIFKGFVKFDIFDMLIGYYLVTFFLEPRKINDFKIFPSKLLPTERYALIAVTFIFTLLSFVPIFLFSISDIPNALNTLKYNIATITAYCCIGILWRRYNQSKETTQSNKEQ